MPQCDAPLCITTPHHNTLTALLQTYIHIYLYTTDALVHSLFAIPTPIANKRTTSRRSPHRLWTHDFEILQLCFRCTHFKKLRAAPLYLSRLARFASFNSNCDAIDAQQVVFALLIWFCALRLLWCLSAWLVYATAVDRQLFRPVVTDWLWSRRDRTAATAVAVKLCA